MMKRTYVVARVPNAVGEFNSIYQIANTAAALQNVKGKALKFMVDDGSTLTY